MQTELRVWTGGAYDEQCGHSQLSVEPIDSGEGLEVVGRGLKTEGFISGGRVFHPRGILEK